MCLNHCFRNLIVLLLLLVHIFESKAQFYSQHYIAPAPFYYFSDATELVIATDAASTVSVDIKKSDGTLVSTVTTTKGSPTVYRFSGNPTSFNYHEIDTILAGQGINITASEPVSVNLRNVASDQVGNAKFNTKGNVSLTSFGNAGIGTTFRVGYYRNSNLNTNLAFGNDSLFTAPIYSVLAINDNTSITIDGVSTVILNEGESYLFQAPMGTLVETSSAVVMNTSARVDRPNRCGDGALDQMVPLSVLGTEYFIIRGLGGSTYVGERTTIISTEDSTLVTVETYDETGLIVSTLDSMLTSAGDFVTIENGNGTPLSSNRIISTANVVVYSGTASGCEVDVATIAPNSLCSGSEFVESFKFRKYNNDNLPYTGYILLNDPSSTIELNGVDLEVTLDTTRYQIGSSGWYLLTFTNTQISDPDTITLSSTAKMSVSLIQQGGGFSMAALFSNFTEIPSAPSVNPISGPQCTNETAKLSTNPGFAPYQWYLDGNPIIGANADTIVVNTTGSYSVSSTLVCGEVVQSNPVSVVLCSDVGVEKTVSDSLPVIGSTVEFTITATCFGPSNVNSVLVYESLPSGYTFVSANPPAGTTYNNVTGVWTIGEITAGQSISMTLEAIVESSGSYINEVEIYSAGQPDLDTTNNSSKSIPTPQTDTDGDGIGDFDDLDDDNDGILDVDERAICSANLALAGVASQSSTLSTYTAANLNDDSDANLAQTSSTGERYTWMDIDLGTISSIFDIEVLNPISCCSDKLSNAYLMVSSNPFPTSVSDIDTALSNAEYIYQFGTTTGISSFTIPVVKEGRYIRLQKSGGNVDDDFSISEIRAFAACDTDGDGIYDHLDPDADADGCPDALEGGGTFANTDILNDTLTGGVDEDGIPLVVGPAGQTVGASNNDLVALCCNSGTITYAISDGVNNTTGYQWMTEASPPGSTPSTLTYGIHRSTDYCIDGTWRHYYDTNEPNLYLFSIEMGSNTTEIDYIDIRVAQNPADRYDTIPTNAMFVLERDWHVQTVGNAALTAPVNIRFYFPPSEFEKMLNQAIALANEDPTAVPPTAANVVWFKNNSFDPLTQINPTGDSLTSSPDFQILTPTSTVASNGVGLTDNSGIGNNTNYVQFDNINNFSGGTAYVLVSGTALPLELLSFNAQTNACANELTWRTAMEKDFSHFVIEHSEDGRAFTAKIQVPGQGAVSGQVYHYSDEEIHSLSNYYRLKMIDVDGSFEYSKVIYVSADCHDLEDWEIYPNPISSNKLLNLSGYASGDNYDVQIYDVLGSMVKQFRMESDAGYTNEFSLDVSNLPAGIYMMKTSTNNTSKVFVIK